MATMRDLFPNPYVCVKCGAEYVTDYGANFHEDLAHDGAETMRRLSEVKTDTLAVDWLLAVRTFGLEACQQWEAVYGLDSLIQLYQDQQADRQLRAGS